LEDNGRRLDGKWGQVGLRGEVDRSFCLFLFFIFTFKMIKIHQFHILQVEIEKAIIK